VRLLGLCDIFFFLTVSQENSSAYYVADQTGEDPNGSDSVWDPWSIPDHLGN
jgi:hypothetical protein